MDGEMDVSVITDDTTTPKLMRSERKNVQVCNTKVNEI